MGGERDNETFLNVDLNSTKTTADLFAKLGAFLSVLNSTVTCRGQTTGGKNYRRFLSAKLICVGLRVC
jgi:hypothetical protein